MCPRKRLPGLDEERQTELGVRILSHTANVRVQDRGRDEEEKRKRKRRESDRGRG